MTDTPPDSSKHLELLLTMRQEVRSLEALLHRELSQWHGLSVEDFLLMLAVYQAPERQIQRAALASVLGDRLVELVKRIRPLQRIGLIATASDDAEDLRSLPVRLTEQGIEVLGNALITANDVAAGGLTARWKQPSLDALTNAFDGESKH